MEDLDGEPPIDPLFEPKRKAPKRKDVFDNVRMTELTKQWQALMKEVPPRRDEAMPLLEEIIKGCQSMIPQFAQYEGFTRTVDVETLTAAASAKLERYLLTFDPNRISANGLFSYLSKSQSGDTRVTLEDGTQRRLDQIVNNRELVRVLSWDYYTKQVVARPVTAWIRSPANKEEWRKLTITRPGGGRYRCIYITGDHQVMTNKGFVEVDQLTSDDQLLMRAPHLSQAGEEALLGMYLGDAHIRKDNYLVVSHSTKQRAYVAHLSDKLWVRMDDFDATIKGIDKVYPSHKVGLGLTSLSDICQYLPQQKIITPWIVGNLTPRAVAYWYMDDGSVNVSDRPRIATEGFTKAECGMLIEGMRRKFNIGCTFSQRRGKQWVGRELGSVLIDRADRAKFFTLVAPYVIPPMRFKLPPRFHDVDYIDTDLMEHRLIPCAFKVRKAKGKSNVVYHGDKLPDGKRYWEVPDFKWKYDITVDETHNFFSENVLVHNCFKNVFRTEASKVNQYRKYFHSTGENLEKYYGEEDYRKFRAEAAEEVKSNLKELTCRWGDLQEIGTVRFILMSLLEDREETAKETPTVVRERIIRSAGFAWCVSPDLARYFYQWAVYALRDALDHKISVRFTLQDVLRHAESYTFLPELIDIVGWDRAQELFVKLGGARIRLPTVQQLGKLHEKYLLFADIQREGEDPDTIEKVGRRRGFSSKTAQQAFEEMSETLDHRRLGDNPIFGEPEAGHSED